VLVLLLAGISYYLAKQWFTSPLATVTEPTLVEIKRGSHARSIARLFSEKGVFESSDFAYWSARLLKPVERLQAGVYQLEPGMSPEAIWDMLAHGEQHLFSITFPEGLNFSEWQNLIAGHPWLVSEWQSLDAESIAARLELPFDASHPEGLLYPDTYKFHAYTTDGQLYSQAVGKMRNLVMELWEQRADDLPITSPYEALILASIVEKETGADQERGLVASVFVNRMRTGMRLQSDPTIVYGLGERYRGVIYRSDIQEHTPYNTYRIHRLPPTPIAMPGRAALAATLNPPASDYFYFVSRNDGTHVFSKTLQEHNRAVQEYQRN